MKSSDAASKSKSHEARSVPTADDRAAAFARQSQKDRDNFERQITNATTKSGEALANLWRRFAGVGLALATKQPKVTGVNTIQFYIPDGNYRKQVYAMHLADTGEMILYLPNVLADAVKAKLITPVKSPTVQNTYTAGGETLVIEPLDGESINPQFYFKDMTGWNRKAIAVHLPATAGEGAAHAAEQLMALAATWPAPAAEPAK